MSKNTDQQQNIIREYLEPELDGLMQAHHNTRFEWFPSDLIPANRHMTNEQKDLLEQTKQQAQDLPNAARVGLVLNLITEEGLPSYHRLLGEAFGDKSAWVEWRNQWTAEEDRHGNILRDYLRDCRVVDMQVVEKMQFSFVAQGWSPAWGGSAYDTLAYTSFQERATQYSHRNLGKLVRSIAPSLTKVLACVAGDESRHYSFYCSLLKKLVQVDLRNALESMLRVLKTFKMPGSDIPGFTDMSLVEHAYDVFGPKEFSAVITDVIKFTGLEQLTNLDTYCEDLRQKVLAYPVRLLKLHNKFIGRVKEKVEDLKFDFLEQELDLAA